MTKPDTRTHTQTFLSELDADYRLFRTARSFIEASPKNPDWNKLRDWCLEKVKSIAGTASVEDGLRNPDVRTLMAVGYLAFVQAPPSKPSTPTRALLEVIESDFLTVLLRETKAAVTLLPSFKGRLAQAEQNVSEIIQRLGDAVPTPTVKHPEGVPLHSPAASNDGGWAIIGFTALVLAVLEVRDKLKNKT